MLLTSTDNNFSKDTATGVVLVDFWAEWCGPCQIMLPRLTELASKFEGKAKIMKHNVDTEPQTPTNLRVMAIPTMILFKDGKMLERWTGVQDIATLTNKIESYL